jgi:hypothetical protein
MVAIGFLAVARWPVSMGTIVKPYSFDLFFSLVLLLPAVYWLRRPEQTRWLGLLVVVAPLALMGSYPAVFVAGGVSLALLPTVWRRHWTVWSLYAAYNLLMLAAFFVCHLVIGREQLDPVGGTVKEAMQVYWADGFPPAEAGPLLRWLVLIHTGRMMAYPFGEANGGSALTFLLFVLGLWTFVRLRRWQLVVLWLTPFALGLIAGAIRAYPYGGCCRLSQHVAPVVCLLSGAGVAQLIQRARSLSLRRRWAVALGCLLAFCGFVEIVIDAGRPYREEESVWIRHLMEELSQQVGPADRIVLPLNAEDTWPLLRWQLSRWGDRVSWGQDIQADQLVNRGGRLWALSPYTEGCSPWGVPQLEGLKQAGTWAETAQITYTLRRPPKVGPTLQCNLTCWARAEDATRPRPLFSSWP